ncbi:unnamed protein product [Taenia asiatica]|uniref:Exocyst subunit Exo70 family protein n=1 Tax=Taenia asiatica TaxID=60517 RepID=A0A0R3WFN8_TAEAS|nr:unnamed protein product [Taenia asiatica]
MQCALRADHVINIEVYCQRTGGSGGIGSASVAGGGGGGGGASTDRHQASVMEKLRVICRLMCADSEVEMESWVKGRNGVLEVLQHWMPEHFARVARYDSGLTFTLPVAACVS